MRFKNFRFTRTISFIKYFNIILMSSDIEALRRNPKLFQICQFNMPFILNIRISLSQYSTN